MTTPAAYPSAAAMLAAMEAATADGATFFTFAGTIAAPFTPASATLETPLFPPPALAFYSALNLGEAVDEASRAAWYSPARGGPQGDYARGMPAKVANVVDALTRFPHSKRAVLTVFSRSADHTVDEEAKCLRELHFFVRPGDERLHCAGFMRAQAASIFPKNIHFIASVLERVCRAVGREPGTYTHSVTVLTGGR